ncbi:MAG TPA: 16S rRNA (guanine(966)-N(2))-methyltransferase RsmD [Microbacteriaceae bacterium]
MSRIIAGFASGRKLISPAKTTRPSSDRLKESLFGMLESRGILDGASVLDLFAGTGAVGLEAISRGAKKLVMVEKDANAMKVCLENAELVSSHLPGEVEIQSIQQPVFKALENLVGSFDLIFLDPPYDYPMKKLSENLEQLLPLAQGMVVLEKSSKTQLPETSGWEITDTKTYGDSELVFLTKDFAR